MKAKNFLRNYAQMMDASIGGQHVDSTAWIGLAFDLAAAADHYGGLLIHGYRPGLGGSSGALAELSKMNGSHVLRYLSRQRPEVLANAAVLAYAYGTALEGRREQLTWY